jgi:hypothetical protein
VGESKAIEVYRNREISAFRANRTVGSASVRMLSVEGVYCMIFYDPSSTNPNAGIRAVKRIRINEYIRVFGEYANTNIRTNICTNNGE